MNSWKLAFWLCLFFGCGLTGFGAEPVLQTTHGPVPAGEFDVILPHEHVFTDLRGPDTPGYGQADPDDVVRAMKPLLEEARAQGVDLLVECTTIGVGRNVPVLARLSRETDLPMLIPTGVYGRAEFAPQTYREMSEPALTEWMIREITEGIEDTGIKAGFIKIATSADGMKPLEEKFLRTACRAARKTGVAIASHTTSGAVAARQIEILREEQLSPNRFIWVHSQAENDPAYHLQLAGQGAYIEFDSVRSSPEANENFIPLIRALVDEGYSDRILLSHDAGWYQPGKPDGGQQRPYTALLETFVPQLREAGFEEETIQQFIRDNPRRAFAISK